MFYLIFGVYFVFVSFASALTERFQSMTRYLKRVTSVDKIGDNIFSYKRMMVWNFIAIVMLVLVGGLILMGLEDWTFIQGIYFALETSTVSTFLPMHYIPAYYSHDVCRLLVMVIWISIMRTLMYF